MSETFQDPAKEGASRLLHEVLLFNDSLKHSLCRELEINETDFDALQHLTFGTPLTPSELAAKLRVSTAATTALIDRLSARGRVVRTPNPADRRSILIRPSTGTVELVVAAMRPLFDASSESMNNISAHEQQIVTSYLEHVLAAINGRIDTLEEVEMGKRGRKL